MSKSITVDELIKNRDKLQLDIAIVLGKLFNDFSTQTGIGVSGVSLSIATLRRHIGATTEGLHHVITDVEVDVDLNL